MSERWIQTKIDPNYFVSDRGSVKRVACVRRHSLYGEMKLKEKLMRPGKNHDGYYRINMGNNNRIMVHVLVLESFVGPRPEGMQACHNNGNPADNRLDNLRWGSPKENVSDRIRHGTDQYGEKNPSAKYTDQQILDVCLTSLPAREASAAFGVKLSTVYLIRCGAYERARRLLAEEQVQPLGIPGGRCITG